MNKIKVLLKSSKVSIILILGTLSVLVDTVGSYLSGIMTQAAIDRNLEVLIPVVIYELFSYFVINSLNYMTRLKREKYTQELAIWFRGKAILDFQQKYQTQDDFQAGSTYVNLTVSDMQYFEQYFGDVIKMILQVVEIVVVIIFIAQVNLSVILFNLIFFLVMLLLPKLFESRLGLGMAKVSEATKQLTADVENHIHAAPTLKNLDAFSLLFKIVQKDSKKLAEEKIKRIKTDTKYNTIMVSLNAFSQIALLCYATFLAFQGYIQFGMIFALTSLSG